MPRPSSRPYARAALLLVALLSAVLLGGVEGSLCARHGVSGLDVGGMAGAAGHGAMAGMSHDMDATDNGSHGDHGGCCTCIGDCTMVAPLGNAPVAATLILALVVPEPVRPLDAEPRRAPRVEPDRLLPFANGPPASPLA